MISQYDLIEILQKNSSNKEVIEDINDMIYEIEKDPKEYIRKLSEEIEEFANSYDLCPLCGSELIGEISFEKSECLGKTVYEKVKTNICSNCECSYRE